MPSDFLERTLEDIIYESRATIHERGLPPFYKNTKRQFRLPSGKTIDIFTWEIDEKDSSFYARIYELKKELLTEAALLQILGYYEEIFCAVKVDYKTVVIENILVGTAYTNTLRKIQHITDDIKMFSYKYCYDGVRFKQYGITRSVVHQIEYVLWDDQKPLLNTLRTYGI